MAEYSFPELDPEFQVTVFPEPDSRGPVVTGDDQPLPEHPVAELFAAARYASGAGVVSAATRVPSLQEIIGWSEAMRDAGPLVKHKPERVEDRTLFKSSRPGMLRLKETVIETGEVMTEFYDHNGVCTFTTFEPA